MGVLNEKRCKMDKRFDKKYNKCDKSDNNKDSFHFFIIYNSENINSGDIVLF